MRTGANTHAFTVVETMIFLAISGVLFTVVVLTISGRQAKTEFTQSVRNFESRLLDVANDVSTGYYSNSNNFTCIPNVGAPPTIGGGAVSLGTHTGCIFVGQVAEFTINTGTFSLYPLAGNQKTLLPIPGETQDIVNAYPKSINAGETENLSYGMVVGRVSYNNGGPDIAVRDVAITTTFGAYGNSGNLDSGDINANLVPLAQVYPAWIWATAIVNPSNGVKICIQDSAGASASKHADIILGGNGRQLTTQVNFGSNSCS